ARDRRVRCANLDLEQHAAVGEDVQAILRQLAAGETRLLDDALLEAIVTRPVNQGFYRDVCRIQRGIVWNNDSTGAGAAVEQHRRVSATNPRLPEKNSDAGVGAIVRIAGRVDRGCGSWRFTQAPVGEGRVRKDCALAKEIGAACASVAGRVTNRTAVRKT